MPDRLSLRLCIEGRVQGVWFRGWTVEMARHLGLSGWVRNQPDGSVEVLVSGSAPAVEAMVAACRHGPPSATVLSVTATPAAPPPEDGFWKKPSA